MLGVICPKMGVLDIPGGEGLMLGEGIKGSRSYVVVEVFFHGTGPQEIGEHVAGKVRSLALNYLRHKIRSMVHSASSLDSFWILQRALLLAVHIPQN